MHLGRAEALLWSVVQGWLQEGSGCWTPDKEKLILYLPEVPVLGLDPKGASASSVM